MSSSSPSKEGKKIYKLTSLGPCVSNVYAAQPSAARTAIALSKPIQWIEELRQQMGVCDEDLLSIYEHLITKHSLSIDSQVLGRGGNGIVVKGVDKQDKKRVAVKILKCQNEDHVNNNIREFQNMSKCASKHVVRPKHLLHLRTANNIFQFLVMERCQMDLKKFIKERETKGLWMSRRQVYEICLQLVIGLADMHANNILHLDIKPANVLFGYDLKWKFTDLGVSKNIDHTHDHTVNLTGITAKYASPEQYQLYQFESKKKITRQSDIYSLGVLFLELSGVNIRDKWVMKQKMRPKDFSKYLNPEFKVFNDLVLVNMLQYQPAQRASLEEVYAILLTLLANEAAVLAGATQSSQLESIISTSTAGSTTQLPSARRTESVGNLADLQQIGSRLENPSRQAAKRNSVAVASSREIALPVSAESSSAMPQQQAQSSIQQLQSSAIRKKALINQVKSCVDLQTGFVESSPLILRRQLKTHNSNNYSSNSPQLNSNAKRQYLPVHQMLSSLDGSPFIQQAETKSLSQIGEDDMQKSIAATRKQSMETKKEGTKSGVFVIRSSNPSPAIQKKRTAAANSVHLNTGGIIGSAEKAQYAALGTLNRIQSRSILQRSVMPLQKFNIVLTGSMLQGTFQQKALQVQGV